MVDFKVENLILNKGHISNIRKCKVRYFMLRVGFIFLAFNAWSQDIHFSQMERSPLNLNPAETGHFLADHRIVANYRNQWASVTVPYKTFSASYENLQKNRFKLPGNIGLGLLLNSDVAGDGNFGTFQIKFSLAYEYINLLDSTLNIALGMNMGYNQHSLDFNRLYFDSQYNGTQYDPSSQTNEQFSVEQFSFFDFTLGFRAQYQLNKKTPINFGLVFNHLNRPSQSFYAEEVNKLDGKFNTYLSSRIKLSKYWTVIPALFYYHQGTFDEFFVGFLLEKELNNISFRTFNFGLTNRTADALIFRIGMQYQSFDIGFSYDYNYSGLRVASNGVGAFELSIIYLMYNPTNFEMKYNRQCPVFM